jgi:hypothetical protein
MAGLPLSTWLLLLASVGIGLAIELVFYARPSALTGPRLRTI